MQLSPQSPKELEQAIFERLAIPESQRDSFLNPRYDLGDLWRFRDMEKAVKRLYEAVKNNEQIGIYSDYDCDGIPGAVVLIELFKKLKIVNRVHVYIPDRHEEGYGIKNQGIEELKGLEVSLMITVDVGITAIDEITQAQNTGIDVILTDHHAPLSVLPKAFAVIHPSHGDYENQDPCGAAVAFFLVCAFLEKHRVEFEIAEGWEKWLLDLVGFATLSDMVPLRDGNRMLAYYGLYVMRRTRRVGLKTVLEKNSIAVPNVTESDLTFTLAPRLNAASRMASPMLAFELVATDDQKRATEISKTLDTINNERKTLVATIVKSAHATVSHRQLSGSLKNIVVVGNPLWRPAVLGLVANKLVDKFQKSFFVWGEGGDGSVKGSCRMISEHHAALLFQALPDGMMLHAGGHQAAGGFSVVKENVHLLESALNDALDNVDYKFQSSDSENLIPLPLASASARHLQSVRKFAPFGVGNPEPEFLFENVLVVSVKMFGKNKEHLECVIRDATGSATAFTFFAEEDLIANLSVNEHVSIIGTLEAGWRGGVRIRIRNIK